MKKIALVMFLALVGLLFSQVASAAETYCHGEANNSVKSTNATGWCTTVSTSPFTLSGPDWGSNVCGLTDVHGFFHNDKFTTTSGDYIYIDRTVDSSKPSGFAWELVMRGSGDRISGTMTCIPTSTFTFSTVATYAGSGMYSFAQTLTPSTFGNVHTATDSFCFLSGWGGIQRNQYDYGYVYVNTETGYYDVTSQLGQITDKVYASNGCVTAGSPFTISSQYGLNTYVTSQSLPSVSSAFCFFAELEGPFTDVTSGLAITNNGNGTRTASTTAGAGNQTPGAGVTCVNY